VRIWAIITHHASDVNELKQRTCGIGHTLRVSRFALIACLLACAIAVAIDVSSAAVDSAAARADRQVAWVIVANEAAAERELNAHAARGLRFATASDGLACGVAVMQTPDPPVTGTASYRLVADRDLPTALPDLTDDGYEPRGLVRRQGGRAHVIWERGGRGPDLGVAEWRLVEFANPDTLEADLAMAAGDGFQPRLLARTALRSWPGLSEKGLVLMGRAAAGGPREVRVLRGTRRDVDDLAKEVESLGAQGWSLDVAFSSSRDGSREARRERVYLVFSREVGRSGAATPVRLVRSSSWGLVASGRPLAAMTYWNDFLFAYRPEERRQMWASPIRLSAMEANCAGLSFKLRVDGGREQRSTIVGAVARPLQGTSDVELVVILDERIGG